MSSSDNNYLPVRQRTADCSQRTAEAILSLCNDWDQTTQWMFAKRTAEVMLSPCNHETTTNFVRRRTAEVISSLIQAHSNVSKEELTS